MKTASFAYFSANDSRVAAATLKNQVKENSIKIWALRRHITIRFYAHVLAEPTWWGAKFSLFLNTIIIGRFVSVATCAQAVPSCESTRLTGKVERIEFVFGEGRTRYSPRKVINLFGEVHRILRALDELSAHSHLSEFGTNQSLVTSQKPR